MYAIRSYYERRGQTMKIRHPLLIRLAGFLIALLVRVWLSTIRVRVYWPDPRTHPLRRRDGRSLLYALWHETLLLSIRPYRRPPFRA